MKISSTPVIVSSTARRSTTRTCELLVLGLGNVLVGDDGLGSFVVDRLLRDFDVPDGLCIVDGGTLGLALLPLLQDCQVAIFVDAVRSGDAPPGTLIRIEGDDVLRAVRQHLSVHQIGVADLLDAAQLTGRYPSQLILIGLVPGSLDLGTSLSAPVRRTMDSLVGAVLHEIARCGYSLHERCENADPHRDRGSLDRLLPSLGRT